MYIDTGEIIVRTFLATLFELVSGTEERGPGAGPGGRLGTDTLASRVPRNLSNALSEVDPSSF